MQTLSLDQIRYLAPSIFTETPHPKVTDRYLYVNTAQAIEALQKEGWFPTSAKQCIVRDETNQGFQKHLVRFSREELAVNGERIELILINSHNTKSAFQLLLGIFRIACINGLIVGDTFNKVSIRHVSYNRENLVNASYQILEDAPKLTETISQWKQILLAPEEKEILATSSASLVFPEMENKQDFAYKLLTPRRQIDSNCNNLWGTFNIIQENIIKGGLWYYKNEPDNKLSRKRTRAIKSIDRDTKLNKELFTLAEEMAKIKNGQN